MAKVADYGSEGEELVGMVKISLSPLPKQCRLLSVVKRLKDTFGKRQYGMGPSDAFDELQSKFIYGQKLKRGATAFSVIISEEAYDRIVECQEYDVQLKFGGKDIEIVCRFVLFYFSCVFVFVL